MLITNKIEDKTISQIVSAYPETAALFEKYEIDFCCGGKRLLQDVLAHDVEKRIEVEAGLEQILNKPDLSFKNFELYSLSELINHIVRTHHKYIHENVELIQNHLEKVVMKHGQTYPQMSRVLSLFINLKNELLMHMKKEDMILFPAIKKLEAAYVSGRNMQPGININTPVSVMEQEHEDAHQLLEEIKSLTNKYSAPASACTTHRLSIDELRLFEEDLHKHIHLENNILFPKALELTKTLNEMA